MSQHVHSTNHAAHVMAPVVAFLQKQEAIQQGNQTQAQLQAIITELHKLPDYQRAVQQGMPAIGVPELDAIVKRVQQSRFGSDSGENRGDREARLAQRNANGMIDWVVTQLSESFDDHREAFRRTGVALAELDDIVAACANARGVFGIRWDEFPRAFENHVDFVRSSLALMYAEPAV